MIVGKLKRRRVVIDGAADASTLRNKGFRGRNIGESLSLDLVTSSDLLIRKRIEIFDGGKRITLKEIENMMTRGERKNAVAFHYLRSKGKKPLMRKGKLYLSGKRVLVYAEDEHIHFPLGRRGSSLLAITDPEWNCLLYSVSRVKLGGIVLGMHLKLDAREGELKRDGGKKGFSLGSALKYGSTYRIYDGHSPHAKYLMQLEKESRALDLVARVRIAQSVRKAFLLGIQNKKKSELTFYEVRWIRQ